MNVSEGERKVDRVKELEIGYVYACVYRGRTKCKTKRVVDR